MVLETAQPAIRIVSTTATYGQFVVEPLPRGYGHTIGNPLRRVLLSSLPGAAISRITVEGVLHEFSVLPFVKEDVTQLILNLKDVRLRIHGEGPFNAVIEKKGPGRVTDADIKVGPEVEIINPEHYLATLDNASGTLRIEMVIERGVGYVGAEEQTDRHEIGVIPIDARFTPIRKVQYTVESARVGQATDFDRLILNVWTDGSVTPEDAVAQASTILVDSYRLMSRAASPQDLALADDSGADEAALGTRFPVEELKLSNRALNCLKRHGIESVEQLRQMSEEDLFELRGMGVKLVEEIKERLAERGMSVRGGAAVSASESES